MNAWRQPLPIGFRMTEDRRSTLMAFGLAVSLHVICWIGLPVRGVPRVGTVHKPGPAVSYLPAPLWERHSASTFADVRAVRSPTVFSLPTPFGFSRASLEQPLLTPPPMETPAAAPAYRIRDEAAEIAPRFRPAEASPNLPAAFVRPVASTPTYPKRQVETNRVVYLTWLEGLSSHKSQRVSVPPDSVWDDDKPWEATFAVEVGPDGMLRHVFIEKATANKKRNLEIARALRTFHLPPSGTDRAGRVLVRFNGGAPVVPLAEATTTP